MSKTRPDIKVMTSPSGITIDSQSEELKTLEDVLIYCDVDTKLWEPDKYSVNFWDVTMSAKSSGTGQIETKRNYQIKVFLVHKYGIEANEGFIDALHQYTPQKLSQGSYKAKKSGNMAVISIADHHFLKLAWRKETGDNYDIKIAKSYYLNAVADLVSKAGDVEKYYFPVGNDFLHINNAKNSTAADTPQDVDGRLKKGFMVAAESCIQAIEMMIKKAPVHYIWVPGNHDTETSWYLSKTVEAYFRNNKRVTFDVGEKSRKCIIWGETFIGYTHKARKKYDAICNCFADEFSEHWSKKHREIHLGHKHTERVTSSIDTINGTIIRELPSMSATDYWHYDNMFTGNRKYAQAYLYNKKVGLEAVYNAYARSK